MQKVLVTINGFKRFPRDKDGSLAISAHTRAFCNQWVSDFKEAIERKFHTYDADLLEGFDSFEFLNQRLNSKSFTSTHEIFSGLNRTQRSAVGILLISFLHRGQIERIGSVRQYQYRLTVARLERERKRSVLKSIKAQEVARRYL